MSRGSTRRLPFDDHLVERYLGRTLRWIQCCQADAFVWRDSDSVDRVAALVRSLRTLPIARAQTDRVALSSALARLAWQAWSTLHKANDDDIGTLSRHMPRRARVCASLSLLIEASGRFNLTLDALADRLGLTTSYLSRAMSAETRLTFASIVNSVRLIHAVLLVRASSLRINAVADAVGYLRTSELDRQFKRWIHMTPTTFRHATHGTDEEVASAREAVRQQMARRPGASPAEVADSLGVDFGVALAEMWKGELQHSSQRAAGHAS